MTIDCLIIDDEQLARDMLHAYAGKIPYLRVVAKCKSASEAERYMAKQKIDLLLLDINMPRTSGIEFLRKLKVPPKVIFTTAYSDYTLEGYALEVVDYLLKPIGFERFRKAIQRAQDIISTNEKAKAYDANHTFEKEYIIVKEGHNHQTVFLKDILYVMAMREYIQYHTTNGKYMELKSISTLEKTLPTQHFLRIHRSYIVAKSAVLGHHQNSLILKKNLSLPIGKTYKQKVLQSLFQN
ncbi:MAG: response regulator transcription factor, partial [Bacteroidota bacterium]